MKLMTSFVLASCLLSYPMTASQAEQVITTSTPPSHASIGRAIATGFGTGLLTGTLSGTLGGLGMPLLFEVLLTWPCATYARDQLIKIEFDHDDSIPASTPAQIKNQKAYAAASNIGHLTAWLSYFISYAYVHGL